MTVIYFKIFQDCLLVDEYYIGDWKKIPSSTTVSHGRPEGLQGVEKPRYRAVASLTPNHSGRLRLRLIFLYSSVGSRPVQTTVPLSDVTSVLWILRREILYENEKVSPFILVLTQDKNANIAVYPFSCWPHGHSANQDLGYDELHGHFDGFYMKGTHSMVLR